jgi:hypothetical protein
MEPKPDEPEECCDKPWMPSSINVYAGEGVERIDIAPSLVNKDDLDPAAALRRNQTSLKIIFPVDVYPPQWEHRKKIEQAVIEAGAESNNYLIRNSTLKLKNGNQVSVMGCRYSQPSRNWKKHIDPDEKLKARRSTWGVTTKLPVGQLCSFMIKLTLYPGQYWCIEPWTGNRQHMHHPELAKPSTGRGGHAGGAVKKRKISFGNSSKKKTPTSGSSSFAEIGSDSEDEETETTPPKTTPPEANDQAAIPIERRVETATEKEFEEDMKTDPFEHRGVVQRLAVAFMFDNVFDACEDRSAWNGRDGIRAKISKALGIPGGTYIDAILEEVIECRNNSTYYTGESKAKSGRPAMIGRK